MTQQSSSPHRRAILQSIVSLPIVAAPVAAAAYSANSAPNADAELIALGVRLDEAWAHERSLENATHIFEDAYEAANDVSGEIVERIGKLTAITLAGAKMKAKAIWWCCSGEEIKDNCFSYNDNPTTDLRLVAGLVRDLRAH
jgi:hypothetical protein